MLNNSYPSHVASTSDHGKISNVKFDNICDLVGLQIHLYSIVDTDFWIRITKRASVMSDHKRDAFFADLNTLHLGEFVFSLIIGNSVDCKAAFGVVD